VAETPENIVSLVGTPTIFAILLTRTFVTPFETQTLRVHHIAISNHQEVSWGDRSFKSSKKNTKGIKVWKFLANPVPIKIKAHMIKAIPKVLAIGGL
jgi:hypothetical protein